MRPVLTFALLAFSSVQALAAADEQRLKDVKGACTAKTAHCVGVDAKRTAPCSLKAKGPDGKDYTEVRDHVTRARCLDEIQGNPKLTIDAKLPAAGWCEAGINGPKGICPNDSRAIRGTFTWKAAD